MFQKILIANRGEIAIRVIRACKDMDIKTVAVYSTADKDALHVEFADEAYCIGPPPSAESYLKYANITAVADFANVDAIHPGAGFLAEDAQFAEICEAHQIKFIGPSIEDLITMGDKVRALETVAKAGLKLVPGSQNRKRKKDKKATVETPKKQLNLQKKSVIQSELRHLQGVVDVGYVSHTIVQVCLISFTLQKQKAKLLLEIVMSILKNGLKTHDILKFKY